MKIFKEKPVDRIRIKVTDPQKRKELTQAKEIMNNYLKDKNFKVDFFELEEGCVSVQGINDAKTAIRVLSIKNESDTPFLRNVYKVLEIFAKDSDINKIKN